jgi:hypothetical protein
MTEETDANAEQGIVPYEHPSLDELLADLPRIQQEYLKLRILGISPIKASTAVGRTRQCVTHWRRNPQFLELDERISELAIIYRDQAKSQFIGDLSPAALFFLAKEVERGSDEDADIQDRRQAAKAADLILKVERMQGGSSNESFEEIVIKARRNLPRE